MGREQRLTKKMVECIQEVHQKLLALNIEQLGISEYGKHYFKRKQPTFRYELELYGYAIQKALSLRKNPKYLIEFGGGLGLGSLLASAYCRCNIVYIDIDENIMADASKIASHLGLINVEYQLIQNGQIKFHSNAVLYSKDVIEHVYDLESLFQRLATSHTPSVHLTTANPCNIFRKKYFNQIHAAAENKPSTTHKSGQSLSGYFQERLDYIQNVFQELSSSQSKKLASLSKGLIFNDIHPDLLHSVQNKNRTKVESNTCDPKSGNWAERLLYEEEYRAHAQKALLKHEVFGLPYDQHKPNKLKNIMTTLFNALLNLGNYQWFSLTTTQMHILTPIQE
jgi:hypothetical protein